MDNDLLDLIYGVVGDPERWTDVLIGISDHIRADGGMLIHCPPPGSGQATTQLLARLPEEPAAIYREHYAWNPWTYALARVPFGKAVSANSLIEPNSIQKTAFYADVLAPCGYVDTVNVTHKSLAVEGSIGGFGFCLSSHHASEAADIVRLLDELSPHLSRAFEASLLLGSKISGKQQISIILDLMPNAALLLDKSGRITQANTAAETLLRQSDGLLFDKRGVLRITSAIMSEREMLGRAIQNALNVAEGVGTGSSEPVRISRPSGAPPLLILAIPLPRPSFAFWAIAAPARVIVIVVDPAAKSRATASAMRSAFGLTPAEARVALLLASGATRSQLPELLGVTPATIKTQLRCCFEKTGTHSLAELTRLITLIPPGAARAD